MRYRNHRWFALLFATTLLITACNSQSNYSDSSHSEGVGPQAQDSLDPTWDSEEERLDDLGLPKHKVVIDGEETYSESNQEQWDLFNGGDYGRDAYEEAFLNFVACIEDDHGWINYLDLDDEVINYVTTVDTDPNDYCYHTHFGLIDVDWEVKHPSDGSEAIQFLIDCLEDEGIEPKHDDPASEPGNTQNEQLFDLREQMEEHAIDCEYVDPSFDELHED